MNGEGVILTVSGCKNCHHCLESLNKGAYYCTFSPNIKFIASFSSVDIHSQLKAEWDKSDKSTSLPLNPIFEFFKIECPLYQRIIQFDLVTRVKG